MSRKLMIGIWEPADSSGTPPSSLGFITRLPGCPEYLIERGPALVRLLGRCGAPNPRATLSGDDDDLAVHLAVRHSAKRGGRVRQRKGAGHVGANPTVHEMVEELI